MQHRKLKTMLVAVNAKYIHTGLGVRSIAAYVRRETDFEIDFSEYTINQHEQDILESLYQSKADVYLFSCYIWNIEIIMRLVRNLRQLCPDASIGFGGPQVGYQGELCLQANPDVDFVMAGESEQTVCELIHLMSEGKTLKDCLGVVYREGNATVANPARLPMPLDALAFAYPDIDELPHRIIYYESMRGCPFACSYCTSSIERGVRKRSLPLVFTDLAIFLKHHVPQVKFVDRTFNCDKHHARAIWEWLATHDNGVTNFHFELSGELLDDETLAYLAGIRPGLFQFEIGVQSTHPETLTEIDRAANVPHLLAQVCKLLAHGNIHVHLDLIAGLPYESFDRFQSSFNNVYACLPNQLQLGFLKILPGSKMAKIAKEYGLAYSQNAPYEILFNQWLDYPQLNMLRGIAKMVDIYYNSGRFSHMLSYLVPYFSTPFLFYQALWLHYESDAAGNPVSQIGYYDILNRFMRQHGIEANEKIQWFAKYDLLSHEKPRKLPVWVSVNLAQAYRKRIQAFFMDPIKTASFLPEYKGISSMQMERTAHLEIFPFHPGTGEAGEVAVLFNYKRRDITGLAHACILPADSL